MFDRSKKTFRRCLFALCLLIGISGTAQAEQFPIKTFTSADGLASSALTNIFRDHLGFIWFSTRDGLSRYNGREFTNFQIRGVSSPTVFSFHETRHGDFWIVTGDGSYRIARQDSIEVKPEPETKSDNRRVLLNAEKISDRSFNSFYEDSAGQIWAGDAEGLFAVAKNNGEISFNKIDIKTANNVRTIAQARDGNLWFGGSDGVFRRSPAGNFTFYPIARSSDYDQVFKVTEDSGGRIWIAHTRGIFIIQPAAVPAAVPVPTIEIRELAVIEQTVYANFELPEIAPDTILRFIFNEDSANRREAIVHDVFAASDSKIWFAAQGFLYSAFGEKVRRVSDSPVLPFYIQNFAEDSAGNLWIGTNSGALRLTRQGFTTFKQNDGLEDAGILSMSENARGEFFVSNGRLRVSRFDHGKFDSKPFNLPDSAKLIYATNGVLFDENNLWALTENGLYRFDVNNLRTPIKIYYEADGLKGDSLFCGFKDSKDNLWFSTRKNTEVDGLSVFDRATQKFHAFSATENFPNNKAPVSFAEDHSGNLWFGFYNGGLVKYANGRFTDFSSAENLPVGGLFGLLVDAKNRLWLASSGGGVAVVEDLQSDDLKFKRFTTEQGLATDNARCLTEDSSGNIYAGTVRGIDRITPESGQIRHFSTSDGLSGDFVNAAFRDKNGALWFGTSNGLSKFEPQDDFVQTAPEIFISNLQIAGVRYSVSGFGQKEIGGISVGAAENNLEISFLSVGAGEHTRFQYKLKDDGGSEQNWSAAAEQNSLNLARLAPGTYKFFVRAVNSAGVTSEIPAVISFQIAPHLWQSWWFRLLAALFIIGLIFAIERTRAARLRGLKNAFGKLSVSENRFRQMVEQSPLGTIVFAPDGSIRAVNQAYENFWGVRFEQIKSWDFFGDEQLINTGVTEKLRGVFNGEIVVFPPVSYDPRNNNSGVAVDGKAIVRWIQSFAYPVKTDAGELLEVILVMEDVTDTRRAGEMEQKAKTERLRELEQVRRRIAADLHDDIGSSLTQISIFSEVLQQRIDKSNEKVLEPLEFIAASSRELIDSMSDIVWAINPQKDFLSELSGKMHRFAADILTARNIDFTYTASPIADIALGANLRREVFLIFKESVNNIIKHAACKTVEIELKIDKLQMILSLRDDGKGFITSSRKGGHGLVSMNARATGLGGKLEIVSGKTTGTSVKLIVPIGINAADENIE